ncbi:MAG TPA: hypothetical protein VLX92_13790 [Kofleriaceae bacterium]|nr:hypothetical protein [Kofleriaceae bacterium]
MTRCIAFVALAACATTQSTTHTVVPAAQLELAAHRAQMIQWLHEYAAAGAYPTDDEGMPVSEFQDARGVRCPMAELIHRSGHDDLVAAVVRDNNKVRLADVHGGPLHDWMLDSGLTIDEIAMVQGALTVQEMQQMRERSQRIVAAAGEVRGHLATAELALRNATRHSLEDVAAQLPDGKLAVQRPVKGPVVIMHAAVAVH